MDWETNKMQQYDDLFNFLMKECPYKVSQVVMASQKMVAELESLLIDIKNKINTANVNNDFESIGKYVMYCSQLKELIEKIKMYQADFIKNDLPIKINNMLGLEITKVNPVVEEKNNERNSTDKLQQISNNVDAVRTDFNGILFYLDKSGIKATGYISKKGFVVLKGSRMRDYVAPSLDESRKVLRSKLKYNGVVVNGCLVEDYMFNSSSEAASCLLGAQTSGNQVWHDKDGKMLKLYVDGKPYNF